MRKDFLLALSGLFTTLVMNGQSGMEVRIMSTPSSVLEFPIDGKKGIILPSVTNLPTTPANGTFLFDKNDKKIKMYENGSWFNLSEVGSITDLVIPSGTVDNAKSTIIGSKTSNADGVLVLESKTKALVLPNVNQPHNSVSNPYPGMMCYDTDRKAIAVFDGSVWNYWK